MAGNTIFGNEISNKTGRLRRVLLAMSPLVFMTFVMNNASGDDGVFRHLPQANSSVISGEALSGVRGVVTTNSAAGTNNLQSNSGAISIGDTASVSNHIIQQSTLDKGSVPGRDNVSIEGRAFSHAKGWISTNQAAGQANVQGNAVSMALGIRGSALSESSMGQVLSDQQGLTADLVSSDSSKRKVTIDKTAFSGAAGIIQTNQSAGNGNTTSNSFSLRVGPGGGE